MAFLEQFVALTVATVKADREVSQVELDTIDSLAEGLQLDANAVKSAVKSELQKNVSVEEVAKAVSSQEDKELLLQACTIVALADNKLQSQEVDLLLKVCSALGLSQSSLVLSVAAVCQNNRAIQIEGNDSTFEDEIIIED